MRFRRRLKIEKGMLDVTPLINIFFLLFVFFMFTSSFIFQPGIKVNLPKALTSDMVQGESRVVVVTADDKIFLNDREISREDLMTNLKLIGQERSSLLLKADRRASLGLVVEIWDMCRRCGVSQVNIATGR